MTNQTKLELNVVRAARHAGVRHMVKGSAGARNEAFSFDLSGSEALTYEQIAEELSSATDQKVSCVDVSDGDFKKGIVSLGASAEAADAMIELGSGK